MTTTISIDIIHIGERFRKDLGGLDALAASIKKIGLLHPIGIDSKYNLVFGQRRLEACKQLGLTHVQVRIVDLENPLQAENDENEVRKDFTPSERVAIAQAMKEKAGNRVGRPSKEITQNFGEFNNEVSTDLSFGPSLIAKQLIQEHCPNGEIPQGMETAEYAAKLAGFGNVETYRQAKHVVDNAPQEIVEQMDQGTISINKAFQITKQLDKLPEEQRIETVFIKLVS